MTMSHFSIVACVVAILQGVSQEATKNSHICPQYNMTLKKIYGLGSLLYCTVCVVAWRQFYTVFKKTVHLCFQFYNQFV